MAVGVCFTNRPAPSPPPPPPPTHPLSFPPFSHALQMERFGVSRDGNPEYKQLWDTVQEGNPAQPAQEPQE